MAPLQIQNFQKDVVYLFQFAGTDTVSSQSPFCIKVEAFLRRHNLKFERKNTIVRGSNGLLPFIELNGVQIADSEVIFKKLTDHFHLTEYTDAHDAGIGHALERMIENHTMHLLRVDLCRVAGEYIRLMMRGKVPAFAMSAVASLGGWYMKRQIRGAARTAIGCFTDAEYDEMLRVDLIHLQNVLDEKQFMMGEIPTKVDCVALAHIAYAYYIMPHARCNIHKLLESNELSTLKEYLDRVVRRLFGDDFKDKKWD